LKTTAYLYRLAVPPTRKQKSLKINEEMVRPDLVARTNQYEPNHVIDDKI
jgi:hypothetical protein